MGAERTLFYVNVPAGLVARLDARVRANANADRQRWQEVMAQVHAQPTYRERRLAHAEALAERERMRLAGELLDTRDALVGFHVREQLRRRGWDRDWPTPPPAGWTSLPGRPRGRSTLHRGPDRLTVRLPTDLARRLHSAVYHAASGEGGGGQEPPVTAAALVREAALAAAPPSQGIPGSAE